MRTLDLRFIILWTAIMVASSAGIASAGQGAGRMLYSQPNMLFIEKHPAKVW